MDRIYNYRGIYMDSISEKEFYESIDGELIPFLEYNSFLKYDKLIAYLKLIYKYLYIRPSKVFINGTINNNLFNVSYHTANYNVFLDTDGSIEISEHLVEQLSNVCPQFKRKLKLKKINNGSNKKTI